MSVFSGQPKSGRGKHKPLCATNQEDLPILHAALDMGGEPTPEQMEALVACDTGSATPAQQELAKQARSLYPEQADGAAGASAPLLWAPITVGNPGGNGRSPAGVLTTDRPKQPDQTTRRLDNRAPVRGVLAATWRALAERATRPPAARLAWGLAVAQAVVVLIFLATAPSVHSPLQAVRGDHPGETVESGGDGLFHTMAESREAGQLFRLDLMAERQQRPIVGQRVWVEHGATVELLAVSSGVSDGFVTLLRGVPGHLPKVISAEGDSAAAFVQNLRQGITVFSEDLSPGIECIQYHSILSVSPLTAEEISEILPAPTVCGEVQDIRRPGLLVAVLEVTQGE